MVWSQIDVQYTFELTFNIFVVHSSTRLLQHRQQKTIDPFSTRALSRAVLIQHKVKGEKKRMEAIGNEGEVCPVGVPSWVYHARAVGHLHTMANIGEFGHIYGDFLLISWMRLD